MTIASEITDLQTNLAAAKAAVTTKGGTVGNTGLAGLATEIASIPSGGGDTPTQWGKLAYYSESISSYTLSDEMNCTVSNIDSDILSTYLGQYQQRYLDFYFSYDDGNWYFFEDYGHSNPISTADMPTVTGITVTVDDPSNPWGEMGFQVTKQPDTTSQLIEATLTQAEYESLDGTPYTIGGETVEGEVVHSFKFGTAATTVPDYFLNGTEYLVEVDFKYANSLTSIGNFVFSGCTRLNSPIILPDNVVSVGQCFLENCRGFNQKIVLPSGITSISSSLLIDCSSFNQPLTIPNSVTTINDGFLGHCTNFNQALTLPSGLTSIGSSFLTGCSNFNQPLKFPNGVASIGSNFLGHCNNLTSIIDVGSIPATALSQYSTYSMTVDDPSAPAYIIGFILRGTYANDWSTTLPNSSVAPYRKIVVIS